MSNIRNVAVFLVTHKNVYMWVFVCSVFVSLFFFSFSLFCFGCFVYLFVLGVCFVLVVLYIYLFLWFVMYAHECGFLIVLVVVEVLVVLVNMCFSSPINLCQNRQTPSVIFVLLYIILVTLIQR